MASSPPIATLTREEHGNVHKYVLKLYSSNPAVAAAIVCPGIGTVDVDMKIGGGDLKMKINLKDTRLFCKRQDGAVTSHTGAVTKKSLADIKSALQHHVRKHIQPPFDVTLKVSVKVVGAVDAVRRAVKEFATDPETLLPSKGRCPECKRDLNVVMQRNSTRGTDAVVDHLLSPAGHDCWAPMLGYDELTVAQKVVFSGQLAAYRGSSGQQAPEIVKTALMEWLADAMVNGSVKLGVDMFKYGIASLRDVVKLLKFINSKTPSLQSTTLAKHLSLEELGRCIDEHPHSDLVSRYATIHWVKQLDDEKHVLYAWSNNTLIHSILEGSNVGPSSIKSVSLLTILKHRAKHPKLAHKSDCGVFLSGLWEYLHIPDEALTSGMVDIHREYVYAGDSVGSCLYILLNYLPRDMLEDYSTFLPALNNADPEPVFKTINKDESKLTSDRIKNNPHTWRLGKTVSKNEHTMNVKVHAGRSNEYSSTRACSIASVAPFFNSAMDAWVRRQQGNAGSPPPPLSSLHVQPTTRISPAHTRSQFLPHTIVQDPRGNLNGLAVVWCPPKMEEGDYNAYFMADSYSTWLPFFGGQSATAASSSSSSGLVVSSRDSRAQLGSGIAMSMIIEPSDEAADEKKTDDRRDAPPPHAMAARKYFSWKKPQMLKEAREHNIYLPAGDRTHKQVLERLLEEQDDEDQALAVSMPPSKRHKTHDDDDDDDSKQ